MIVQKVNVTYQLNKAFAVFRNLDSKDYKKIQEMVSVMAANINAMKLPGYQFAIRATHFAPCASWTSLRFSWASLR